LLPPAACCYRWLDKQPNLHLLFLKVVPDRSSALREIGLHFSSTFRIKLASLSEAFFTTMVKRKRRRNR
jgi:hypothetical protein